jgi:hydrogenase expression/formation protein HypC
MCLAIPALIEDIDDNRIANADIFGIKRDVALDLLPAAKVGDYVLVHAGYGIEIVSEEFAQETIELIREFPELIGDGTL